MPLHLVPLTVLYFYLSRMKSLQDFEKKLRHCYENKNENGKNQRQLWLISAALSDSEVLLGVARHWPQAAIYCSCKRHDALFKGTSLLPK